MVATKYCASKNIIEAIHIYTIIITPQALVTSGMFVISGSMVTETACHTHDGSQFPTTWIKVAHGMVMAFRFIHI